MTEVATAPPLPGFLSLQDIAKLSGRKVHQVRYALKSRGVKHITRVGNSMLWASTQLPEIEAALIDVKDRVLD